MSKVIAHIDLNAFFVRAEEIKNPKLQNRPIAIGKDGRGGIVSTCSYKAREYGVRSGMPMFKAKELCKNLIIIPSDFLYYEALSNEFINYLMRFSKIIEQASIDECYIDFTNNLKNEIDPISFFKEIQNGLYRETGLKCSIGVSTTRFLAKMASDIKKPMGITIIRKKDIKNILFNNPIDSYYGIGKKTSANLRKIGIETIGDLYNRIKLNDKETEKIIGKFKDEIILQLNGQSSNIVHTSIESPDSISCRETLPYNINNSDELKYYLNRTFSTCYKRFKKTKMLCGGVEVCFRYEDLSTKTFSKKLTFITENEEIIKDEIIKLFQKNYKGEKLRQIGCAFERLENKKDKSVQMTLFNYDYYEQIDSTLEIINKFNKNIVSSSSKLKRASELLKESE